MKTANNENKDKRSISEYNRRSKIIQKYIYFLDVLVILVSLFYPWYSSRNAARSSMSTIFSEHLTAHSEAITGGIQEFLKQYEIPTRFLEGITENPYLVDCNPQKVHQFIRYCQASRKNIEPKPNIFFLGEKATSFCLIKWNSHRLINKKEDFTFYYVLNPTQDTYILKSFNGTTTDFINFDPFATSGKMFDFTSNMTEIFSTHEFGKFDWKSPFIFGSNNSTIISGSTFKHRTSKESDDSVIISGIGLDIDYLFNLVKSIATIAKCKYALLTLNDQVLITDNGKVAAKSVYNGGYLNYPRLNDIGDPFWEYIYNIRNRLSETIIKEEINGKAFLLKTEKIVVRDNAQFKIIVAFNLETPQSKMLFETSVIFVLALIIIGITYFVIAIFIRNNSIQRSKKLKRVPPLEDEKFTIDENCGALLRIIHNLRRLQLAYPEDSMLNKITDDVVLNLTQSRNSLFCKMTSNDQENTLFGQMLEPPKITSEAKKPPFAIWKKTIGKKLSKIQPITLDFNWDFYTKNPTVIVNQIVWIIVNHDLFFEEIDPDRMVFFITYLVKNMENTASTSLRINALSYLLSNQLKNALNAKIDILAVSLAVALLHTVSGENYCKRVKTIKAVLDSFETIVPGKGEVRTYLKETVSDLLISADNKHVFDLIGEFAVISESAEFSINDNIEHKLIFMKALVKFCDFCPYWSPKETMLKAIKAESTLNDVSQNFKNNYEYIVATKIVNPLIIDFKNIIKIDEIVENYVDNVRELKNLCSIK